MANGHGIIDKDGPKYPTMAGHSDEQLPRLSSEPAIFLFILMFSIFLGEAIVMIILPSLIPPETYNVYSGSAIDAVLLVAIVFPILYLFSFRPLRSNNMKLKKMQMVVQRYEELYRSLVESTEDSIYLVDKDCKYLFMNSRHQARMSLSEGQFMGRPYGDFHSPEDTKEFEKQIDIVIKTGKSIQQEHKSHRDDRYFLRTFSPVKDPFGLVEAVTVVSKDISIVKRA